jgi:hypothetical protein
MDIRLNREKREKIIIECLKKIAELDLEIGQTYNYTIESWTKDDNLPKIVGKDGIQITMCW